MHKPEHPLLPRRAALMSQVSSTTAVRLRGIETGGPADKAGLKQGDVVLEINGAAVRNSADLRNRIGLVRIGDKVDVTYRRNEEERNTSMRVADLPVPEQTQQGMREER